MPFSNPFSKREEFTGASINTLKATTAVTYALALVTTLWYTFHHPHDHHGHTILGQNNRHRTPFGMNNVILSIYALGLFFLQLGYCYHLYHKDRVYVNAAANVGSHFVLHNLFMFGFVMLFVRNFFGLALLLLILNYFNLNSAYFRHSTTPRFIHIPVVSAPLAFNFVALFWVGAMAVDAHSLPARITANIFIWSILGFGMFFLVVFKDYTMGFELSILMAAIGVGQFFTHVIALQWEFAFTIMAILFVVSWAVAFPQVLGRDPFKRGEIVSQDRERAPLLAESEDRA